MYLLATKIKEESQNRETIVLYHRGTRYGASISESCLVLFKNQLQKPVAIYLLRRGEFGCCTKSRREKGGAMAAPVEDLGLEHLGEGYPQLEPILLLKRWHESFRFECYSGKERVQVQIRLRLEGCS